MKQYPKAETPIMTAKEIRELRKRPDLSLDGNYILDELKRWYFANGHLITIGEDYAFRNEINELHKALTALTDRK